MKVRVFDKIWLLSKRLGCCRVAMLFTLLVACLPLHAVEMTGLYVVDLPVSSQQTGEREKVARTGLKQVILRVSGSPEAATNSKVLAALQKPERYVREFGYITLEAGEQGLRFQFDSTLINQLLRQAKLPIWGSNRPGLLMWVAVDYEGAREVVSADNTSEWKKSIEQAAQDRGVPLLFPLMDLQDENAVSVMDVWGLFKGKLESASQRYRSEAILAGRVYPSGNDQWVGRWLFIFDDQQFDFTTRGASINDYPAEALDIVANYLAAHYAVDTAGASSAVVKLKVEGVRSVDDYARVSAHLKSFAIVRDVAITGVEGDKLWLLLTTEGDGLKLRETIALDSKLTPLHEAFPEIDEGVLVIPYQWRP